MNGDPVDEGGQAVRAGFVQAMQTAAMTMNLLQRRGAEARSVADHERRMNESAARAQHDQEVHALKVAGYQTRQEYSRELHELDTQYKTRQIERAEELHALERRIKLSVLERGETDSSRRAAEASADRADKDEIHRLQRRNLIDRAGWERERHELDVEYKKLLIEIRRRAAGFTETLAAQGGDHAAAMRSAAAYAAASNAADLSDLHRAHAAAFAERWAEDAGHTDLEGFHAGDSRPMAQSSTQPLIIDVVADLAEELSYDTYLSNAGEVLNESATAAENPAPIEEAIEASGVTAELGEDLSPLDPEAGPQPPSAHGPEAEL